MRPPPSCYCAMQVVQGNLDGGSAMFSAPHLSVRHVLRRCWAARSCLQPNLP